MTEVEEGRRHGRRGAPAAPCYVWSHFLLFYYPLLVVIYLILLNKNDLHEKNTSLRSMNFIPVGLPTSAANAMATVAST